MSKPVTTSKIEFTTSMNVTTDSTGYQEITGKGPNSITRLATLLQIGFGIRVEKFVAFLKENKGLLAGSSLLWCNQPWCHYTQFDGDLDIWIEEDAELSRALYKGDSYGLFANYHMKRLRMFRDLILFFSEHGYRMLPRGQYQVMRHPSPLVERDMGRDYSVDLDPNFINVNTVYTFTNDIHYRKSYSNHIQVTRKIQVILTSCPPLEMVQQFDIDILRMCWNGTDYMSWLSKSISDGFTIREKANTKSRIEKYTKRGFTLFKPQTKAITVQNAYTSTLDHINQKANEIKEIVNEANLELKAVPAPLVGVDKPIEIASELCSFLQLTPTRHYSISNVVALMCNYIKTNKLQDPDHKKTILCNGPMLELFRVHKMNYSEMQKYLRAYFNCKTCKTELLPNPEVKRQFIVDNVNKKVMIDDVEFDMIDPCETLF